MQEVGQEHSDPGMYQPSPAFHDSESRVAPNARELYLTGGARVIPAEIFEDNLTNCHCREFLHLVGNTPGTSNPELSHDILHIGAVGWIQATLRTCRYCWSLCVHIHSFYHQSTPRCQGRTLGMPAALSCHSSEGFDTGPILISTLCLANAIPNIAFAGQIRPAEYGTCLQRVSPQKHPKSAESSPDVKIESMAVSGRFQNSPCAILRWNAIYVLAGAPDTNQAPMTCSSRGDTRHSLGIMTFILRVA
jgi:hypothetical protein